MRRKPKFLAGQVVMDESISPPIPRTVERYTGKGLYVCSPFDENKPLQLWSEGDLRPLTRRERGER